MAYFRRIKEDVPFMDWQKNRARKGAFGVGEVPYVEVEETCDECFKSFGVRLDEAGFPIGWCWTPIYGAGCSHCGRGC